MAYVVPNPYVSTTHPPVSRFHGGSWVRPQTTPMTYVLSPASVFKPNDFNDGNPALRGLGEMLFNTARGVFGPEQNGGGLFGPSLYGLGAESLGFSLPPSPGYVVNASGGKCYLSDACAKVLASKTAQSHMDMSLLDADANYKLYCGDPAYQAHVTDRCNWALTASAAALPSSPTSKAAPPSGALSALKVALNNSLASAGYATRLKTTEDLGASSCGAIAWYQGSGRHDAATDKALAAVSGYAVATCPQYKPWKAPSKSTATTSSGGGGGGAASLPSSDEDTGGGTGLSKASMFAIGGGVLAVAVAIVGKKAGWF